jgi:hypothetical protein
MTIKLQYLTCSSHKKKNHVSVLLKSVYLIFSFAVLLSLQSFYIKYFFFCCYAYFMSFSYEHVDHFFMWLFRIFRQSQRVFIYRHYEDTWFKHLTDLTYTFFCWKMDMQQKRFMNYMLTFWVENCCQFSGGDLSMTSKI